MRNRTDPGMAVGQLRRIEPEVVDEVFQVSSGGALLRHDRLWSEVDDAYLRKALRRIVFEVRIERRRCRLRARISDSDRVTVWLGLSSARHPQRAAGTADVLNNNRLPQLARHVFADKAGDHIGRSPGGERHDDGDGLVRILGNCRRVQRCEHKQANDKARPQRHSLDEYRSPCPSVTLKRTVSAPPRRARPRNRSPAEQRDELAPLHFEPLPQSWFTARSACHKSGWRVPRADLNKGSYCDHIPYPIWGA